MTRVEATQPCVDCKQDITKVALTEKEAEAVYAWLTKPAKCEQCDRQMYFDWC